MEYYFLGGSKEGFCEDQQEQMMMSKGNNNKLSFSSSSPTSSSSPQYKGGPVTLPSGPSWSEAQIFYENQHQRKRGCNWLGNNYDDKLEAQEEEEEEESTKLELTDVLLRPRPAGNKVDGDDVTQSLGESGRVEREHMFDKVVTPSDVGKLNRLVIPKQHAERYFPLDSSTNEKGLLLNFEDRCGKPWRFRYSYWNSSQSYVMTKGWSRFVKEKKLDAGDIVSFQRGVGELGKGHLYIDWRRRPDAPDPVTLPPLSLPHHFSFHRSLPWSPLLLRPPAAVGTLPMSVPPRPNNHLSHWTNYMSAGSYAYGSNVVVNPCSGSVLYLRSAAPQQVGVVQVQQQGGGVEPVVFESVPVVHRKAASKRLRLFGVNMECPPASELDECDILSSTTIPHATICSTSQPSSHLSPPLQLRLYNGTPLPTMPTDLLKKGKASTSLDLDI